MPSIQAIVPGINCYEIKCCYQSTDVSNKIKTIIFIAVTITIRQEEFVNNYFDSHRTQVQMYQL